MELPKTPKDNPNRHHFVNIIVSVFGLIVLSSFAFVVTASGDYDDVRDDIIAARPSNSAISDQGTVAGISDQNEESAEQEQIEETSTSTSADEVETADEQENEQKQDKEVTATQSKPKSYTVTAQAGEGASSLIRRAIAAHLESRDKAATAGSKLYVEVTLANREKAQIIYIGDSRTYTAKQITKLFDRYQTLSEETKLAWEQRS